MVKNIFDNIFKYRYIIAIILIALGVMLKLNGSSIAVLSEFVGIPQEGLLAGTPRGIRSDEWAIFTPMALSQSFGGYGLESSIIQGGGADVFVVYAQPVLDFFGMIFRPFLDGYILFGGEYGLSFYWCARFICLVLVWFEFFYRIFTDKNKALSIMGAFMVAFAPIVQWWFSINGLVEMLVFGPVAVMLIGHFLTTDKKRNKVLCLLGVYVCAGGYLCTLYPASMIPLAYFYLAILVAFIIENKKMIKITKFEVLGIVILFVAFVSTAAFMVYRSLDTIIAVLQSVYPGSLLVTGGDGFKQLFWSWGNLFFADRGLDFSLNTNVCEQALIFSLAPMGLGITIYNMVSQKKKDITSIAIIIVMIFVTWYCVIGFPEILAKITVMGKTHPHRAMIITGLTNLVLLIRGLDKGKFNPKWYVAFAIAFCYSVVMIYFERWAYDRMYLFRVQSIILMIASFVLVVCVLCYNKLKYLSIILICGFCIMMGGRVNPLQKGIGLLQTDELAMAIRECVAEDSSALWAVEGDSHEMTNYPIIQGAPTINTTQTYPNLDRWSKLDTEHKYEEVYNRYAYILFDIVSEDSDLETFHLVQPDLFTVHATPNQVKNVLGLKYILSQNPLEELSDKNVNFIKKAQIRDYSIYEVK